MVGWVGFRAGVATVEYRKISYSELHNSYLLFNKYTTHFNLITQVCNQKTA
jgi:hypothetical protein